MIPEDGVAPRDERVASGDASDRNRVSEAPDVRSVSNGGISPCEKCGGEDINVAYHKPGCSERDCSCATCAYGAHHKAHGEHLHYHCRTCHYDWLGPVKGRKTVRGIQR